MNLIKRLFYKKIIEVPENNEIKEIETVQLWIVRWVARQGPYIFSDPVEQLEAFSSEEEALKFKESLENAFKLLRYTVSTKVIIEKN